MQERQIGNRTVSAIGLGEMPLSIEGRPDRTQAISRLTRALHEYFVGGIKTNISLFRRILTDPDFQAGKLDTGYLDRLLKSKSP